LKHFAHSTKGRHFEKDKLGLLGSSLIYYFVAIDDRKLPMHAKTYTRLGTSAPTSNEHLQTWQLLTALLAFLELKRM
jgi:hypothetical protein